MGYIIAYLAIVASLLGYSGLEWYEVAIGMIVAFILLIIAAKGGKSNSSSAYFDFDD